MIIMALPIDPTHLEPADFGEKRATLRMEHDAAVDHVREAFTDAGFGILTEYSLSELLSEKVGSERRPTYVIGACNPSMADRALDATDDRLSALTPCNVVVWENRPGVQTVYHVSIMKISRLLGLADDGEEMADIIAETGELVETAYGNLDAA
jgi:uncharacterized protein (DUF302 family)